MVSRLGEQLYKAHKCHEDWPLVIKDDDEFPAELAEVKPLVNRMLSPLPGDRPSAQDVQSQLAGVHTEVW